ncbi:hypothetical protein FOIG_16722 [Fusarium odoratissimum NRRL 54006]|uniref:Uncharacterized protein n=1 Tax=Fusarium odoratissimum (strain NRRL 54006) TaxID=1089451 RepID=X0J172_FUSO5|nr:uncharacterized protein FOIG_16722 [Fusarium odoratissimum NRRL 54006]EXL90000.1 hypothetical protein FOIG_16722 [Fusarium odoratissimum NRRL 54006]
MTRAEMLFSGRLEDANRESTSHPTLTFDEVRNIIWDHHGAASEPLKAFGEEDNQTRQRDMTMLKREG